MTRFKKFLDGGVFWDGRIEMYSLLKEEWRNQDFSPFEIDESFNTNIPIKIITKTKNTFLTEFIVDVNTYNLMVKINNDTLDIAFYANKDIRSTNIDTKKYLGLLGSGIFRSIEKLYELYDSTDWDYLEFNTPKKVKNSEEEIIDNPLIDFYDSKYLQRLLDMKFHGLKLKNRLESNNNVIWEYIFEGWKGE